MTSRCATPGGLSRGRVSHGAMAVAAPVASGAPEAPVREREPDVQQQTEPDRPWDVIVWDDPVNLMSYVVFVLRRVFGFSEPVAHKLMLEVHNLGKALVASEPRERAEMYVSQLHGYGLQATMERSS
ncbi:MAG: ATP-dependent Clp protease adapter ClpS [Intrasporangiaceae bacterium]|nr:ATP-dependent Clp protease adapter ClpS [Intrasporangiaceae bacterium]